MVSMGTLERDAGKRDYLETRVDGARASQDREYECAPAGQGAAAPYGSGHACPAKRTNRGEVDVTSEVESGVSLKYSNLPALTPSQFDALVVTARKPMPKRRPISDRSVAMARAVLLDGATYREAGLGQGGTSSAAKHAVITLLRYWNWSHSVQAHNLFARTIA